MVVYKICSFFGHREIEITEDLVLKLTVFIEKLIVNKNFGIFYFGGFGMFDDLCYKIVSQLKQKYPYVKRIFCLSDPRHQRVSKRPNWLKNEEYEEYVYLELKYDYWYTRIYFRNCEMINRSDFVIFYAKENEDSGAYKALQHAIKNKKDFINFFNIK